MWWIHVLTFNQTGIEYQLLDIDDDFLSMMTPDGSTKEDVKVPEGELGTDLKANFAEGKDLLVTCISAMGEEAAVSFKGMSVCLMVDV